MVLVVVLGAGCADPSTLEAPASPSAVVSAPPAAPMCVGGEVACRTGCTRVDRDATNCGRCGHVCVAGESCVDGVCGGEGAPDPIGVSHYPRQIRARPAVVTVQNVDHIFAVVGDSTMMEPTRLVAKTPSTDWSPLFGGPDGQIQEVSGAAGATVGLRDAMSWGGQAAVYVRGYDGRLWQAWYDASGAGPFWRPVSSGTPFLPNNEPLVAVWRAPGAHGPGVMQVATLVEFGTSENLYVCTLASATSDCAWSNLGAPRPDPIQVGSEVAIDVGCPAAGLAAYAVTDNFDLAFYRDGVWTLLTPPDPDLLYVPSSIVAFSSGSTCYAVATVQSIADRENQIEVVAWDDTSLTQTELDIGAPFPNVAFQLGNFAHGIRAGQDVLWLLANSSGSDHPLWSCVLTGGLAPSCQWQSLGRPADQTTTRYPLGFAMTAAASTVYVTGQVGPTAAYVFGNDGSEWQNHLTLRDPTPLALTVTPDPSVTCPSGVTDCTTSFGEMTSAEYDGTVLFGSAQNNRPYNTGGAVPVTWMSTDDGSTVTEIPFQQPPRVIQYGGDANVVFDAEGTGYYTIVGSQGVGNTVFISVLDRSVLAWSPPTRVPTVPAGFVDRPWLAAHPSYPGALYMTYSAGPGSANGRFTYCDDPVSCAGTSAVWCGSYALPSDTGCGDSGDGSSGCWLDVDSVGDVWLAIGDDSGCDASPFAGLPTAHSIGVRSIHIPHRRAGGHRTLTGATCLDPRVFQNAVSAGRPECVYYVGAAPDPQNQCDGGTNLPCQSRHWPAQFSVAHDVPGHWSLVVQAYRDIASGQPCGPQLVDHPLPHCRAEQMFVQRDRGGRLCGRSACFPGAIDQRDMLFINDDQTPLPLRWEDHIVPAVVALDYGRSGLSWLDFRGTSFVPNISTFVVEAAFLSPAPSVPVEAAFASAPYDNPFYLDPVSSAPRQRVWYGDENQPTHARLHTHFANTITASATSTGSTGVVRLASPFTGP